MNEYRTRITENGRLVIPAALRRQLDIKPGEELIVRLDNDELRIFSLKHSLKKAQSLVGRYTKNKSLVNTLKEIRKKDAESE